MKHNFQFSIFAAAIAILILSCNNQPAVKNAIKEEPLISNTTMQLLSIDTVKLRNIDDEVKLSGEVSFDENKVVNVYPFSSGQVLGVNVSVGDYVKIGQTLATIKSADIAGNYADLTISEKDLAIAKREMGNAEELYKNGISSEKEYLEAKEAYSKAVANTGKMRTQIQINGGGRTTANGTYVVTAPRSGYIVQKLINAGNFIRNDNNSNMFTIGDIRDVWIWANVYETDIAKVKEGYSATVTTLAYPDSVFMGRIDKISQALDPVTKVMKIKIVLPNPNGTLKPEMFANIAISNKETKQMLAVPSSAIINDNQHSFVVVYRSKMDAVIRQVSILKTANNITYISSGLGLGEKVITNNQILIYKKLQDLSNLNAGKN